jgi:hypothetical protein
LIAAEWRTVAPFREFCNGETMREGSFSSFGFLLQTWDGKGFLFMNRAFALISAYRLLRLGFKNNQTKWLRGE